MEENKLTDEEIVKELINESNRGEWSNIGFIDCVEVRVLKNAIDLIRRLQKENEELRSPKFASWKLKFFNLKEEFDKELAEHKKFTQRATSEIERLTKEKSFATRKMMESKAKAVELQKQVDELLNRRIEPKIFHCHADALEPCPKVQQAVREFAEMLKSRKFDKDMFNDWAGATYVVLVRDIDELLKEYEK